MGQVSKIGKSLKLCKKVSESQTSCATTSSRLVLSTQAGTLAGPQKAPRYCTPLYMGLQVLKATRRVLSRYSSGEDKWRIPVRRQPRCTCRLSLVSTMSVPFIWPVMGDGDYLAVSVLAGAPVQAVQGESQRCGNPGFGSPGTQTELYIRSDRCWRCKQYKVCCKLDKGKTGPDVQTGGARPATGGLSYAMNGSFNNRGGGARARGTDPLPVQCFGQGQGTHAPIQHLSAYVRAGQSTSTSLWPFPPDHDSSHAGIAHKCLEIPHLCPDPRTKSREIKDAKDGSSAFRAFTEEGYVRAFTLMMSTTHHFGIRHLRARGELRPPTQYKHGKPAFDVFSHMHRLTDEALVLVARRGRERGNREELC
ncbi:hypothetical protein Bbelb_349000 [Branchiostoma belcheri]|nr:hypothetical protein Bbelb_349000 [Branchiostoma belcheri]